MTKKKERKTNKNPRKIALSKIPDSVWRVEAEYHLLALNFKKKSWRGNMTKTIASQILIYWVNRIIVIFFIFFSFASCSFYRFFLLKLILWIINFFLKYIFVGRSQVMKNKLITCDSAKTFEREDWHFITFFHRS